MSSKKVAQLTAHYSPHRGGVEAHVSELNQVLIKKGFQVTVLTVAEDATSPAEEVLNQVKVVRLPSSMREHKLAVWQWFWQNRQLLTEADIIQVHDVFWMIMPIWPWIRKRVFTTFHGWEGIYPVPKANKAQRWLWSKLSQKTIHVGQFISEFYWDEPTMITYGGIDPQGLPKLVESTIKIKNKLKIVFVGRLELVNEIDLYLNFIKLLREDRHLPSIEVTWVGEGQWVDQCRQLGGVTGMIGQTKLRQQIASADLVMASSYLSILESQAQAKLVLAFFSNRLKERYLKTLPSADQMLISDSIVEMKSRLLDQLNRQSVDYLATAKRVRAQTWRKVTSQYLELWSEKGKR